MQKNKGVAAPEGETRMTRDCGEGEVCGKCHKCYDRLVIDLARETYDRFVMGGWEPQDAYPMIRAILQTAERTSPQGTPKEQISQPPCWCGAPVLSHPRGILCPPNLKLAEEKLREFNIEWNGRAYVYNGKD